MQPKTVISAIAMILSYLLQVAIAPNLAIAEVVAEVTLCCSLALAYRSSPSGAILAGFSLGLMTDLAYGTPLGIRALVFCLAAFAINRLDESQQIENLSIRYFTMVGALLASGILTALLMSIVGYDSNVGYSLLNRTLPAWLYSSVVCLLFLPLVRAGSSRKQQATRPLKETLPPL
ncbi:MAG: rod shape-determining protein MreD [Coriobacteriia bacterium]|nr:rod shape-determining protein MreD [Coriobacteriia bacterium]